MVTAMQAVHCVSWEPLSGQDMRLVWRRSMRNYKEVVPQRLCLRLLAWPLPGKTSQRRQDAVLVHSSLLNVVLHD
jgi:hypothetical protein